MNESHRNISLIVSTMNRPQFLERLLSYYSTNKFVGTIIIGDASTGVTQAKNASLISIPIVASMAIIAPSRTPQPANDMGSTEKNKTGGIKTR